MTGNTLLHDAHLPTTRRAAAALSVVSMLLLCRVAAAESRTYSPPACRAEDLCEGAQPDLLACWAPILEVDDGDRSFNRIGWPRIRMRKSGREEVDVDPERGALFCETRKDRIGDREVLQLVYRIHFTKLPLTPAVFFERHRNVGLLAIITLDASTREALLLTTVYTCGCYRTLHPTDLFLGGALPPGWPKESVTVHGRRLPAVLTRPRVGESRWLIHLASRTHRVDGILIAAEPAETGRIALPLVPMEELRRLPVEGASDRRSSFFHTRGFLKGHVRGAFSPIEGLTAGLLLLDPLLGMDKDFGDPEVTGTRFYTGLLPWRRNVTRLDRLDPLLRSLGFRLETPFLADPSQ
jgi:hypothetical protein